MHSKKHVGVLTPFTLSFKGWQASFKIEGVLINRLYKEPKEPSHIKGNKILLTHELPMVLHRQISDGQWQAILCTGAISHGDEKDEAKQQHYETCLAVSNNAVFCNIGAHPDVVDALKSVENVSTTISLSFEENLLTIQVDGKSYSIPTTPMKTTPIN